MPTPVYPVAFTPEALEQLEELYAYIDHRLTSGLPSVTPMQSSPLARPCRPFLSEALAAMTSAQGYASQTTRAGL